MVRSIAGGCCGVPGSYFLGWRWRSGRGWCVSRNAVPFFGGVSQTTCLPAARDGGVCALVFLSTSMVVCHFGCWKKEEEAKGGEGGSVGGVKKIKEESQSLLGEWKVGFRGSGS